MKRAVPVRRAGYVLVGGRSSRMGRDKALLPFRGGLLAGSVALAVAEGAGSCTLVGNPALYHRLGYPVIADLYPGEGPLGGILTALRHTPADWNLIVACDMPGLAAPFLRRLMEAAEEQGGDVLMPAGPSGRAEPLCSVYHRRAAPVMETAFARGVRKVAEAAGELRVGAFPVTDPAWFQNVNTLEDWLRHAPE